MVSQTAKKKDLRGFSPIQIGGDHERNYAKIEKKTEIKGLQTNHIVSMLLSFYIYSLSRKI